MKKTASILMFIVLAYTSVANAQYVNPVSVSISAGLVNYYAFASSGILCVGANGSTVINGDVGVSPSTSIVGFCAFAPGCPGLVNGNIDTANAASMQAQSELSVVYNDIAARTPDTIYPVSVDIGGLTLTHGIYAFNQDCNVLSGDLILDGAGNSNSVFIFQVAQHFLVGDSINISLINGARADNVFWQVGDSSVNIGMNANMKGTVIANGSISLMTNAVHEGRLFSRTSSISFDANGVGNLPIKCTPPVVDLGLDVLLCAGWSITLDAGNPGANYVWSTGDSTQSIVLSVSDTVYVDVTDTNSCTGSDTIVVTFHVPPVVNFGADTGRCDDYILLDAKNQGSSYLWNTGDTTQMITVSTSGIYIVVVNDSFGCTGTDTIFATIYTKPLVDLGSDIEQCGGSVILDTGIPHLNYLWNTGDTTQMISAVSSGIYSVAVTNPFGCVKQDTIKVTIDSIPFSPQEIIGENNLCPNSSGNIYTTSAVVGADSYLWTVPGDWKIVSGQGTTSLVVDAGNNSGVVSLTPYQGTCSSSSIEKNITVLSRKEPKIPTMFSPNRDGINDTWVIQEIENYPDNELFVYNRWGNEIYAKKGYRNEWNGEELNEGTYYYHLKVNMHECREEQKSYTGYITIMR